MKTINSLIKPEIVTALTEYGGCYAFQIKKHGLQIIENDPLTCIESFKKAFKDEYGISFANYVNIPK